MKIPLYFATVEIKRALKTPDRRLYARFGRYYVHRRLVGEVARSAAAVAIVAGMVGLTAALLLAVGP